MNTGKYMPRTAPLPADPRRQASDMLRAVAYQLSQSVLAWLNLGPDEVLFLEGSTNVVSFSSNGRTQLNEEKGAE
ncbi:MAG TPA: hypothetical protein VJ420_09875 [Candidatus Udaeobacter sp.]|nr:hypothetical protein [Candidatus Udaeobacter sp.]